MTLIIFIFTFLLFLLLSWTGYFVLIWCLLLCYWFSSNLMILGVIYGCRPKITVWSAFPQPNNGPTFSEHRCWPWAPVVMRKGAAAPHSQSEWLGSRSSVPPWSHLGNTLLLRSQCVCVRTPTSKSCFLSLSLVANSRIRCFKGAQNGWAASLFN